MPLADHAGSSLCWSSVTPFSSPSGDMNSSFIGQFKNKIIRKKSKPSSSRYDGFNSKPCPEPQPTRRPYHSVQSSRRTSDEPPPAYSAHSAPSVRSSAHSLATGSDNDPYAFLSQFDTTFIIDDSGSMAGQSWRDTTKALETITPICTAHDADGIDLHFLNAPDRPCHHNVTSASAVHEIFQTVRPCGQTFTGTKLDKILRPYLSRFQADPDNTKPVNIIVITDGAPSDDPKTVIISAASKLNRLDAPPYQVGIQFFQVGREPGAREALQDLDDGLVDLCDGRDMVDTQPWKDQAGYELNADGILKAVLGSVNKQLDNKKLGARVHL